MNKLLRGANSGCAKNTESFTDLSLCESIHSSSVMTKVTVKAEDLTKTFSGKSIFKKVNFSLSAGESAVITGRNGSGKSTLMKIVAGLLSPSSGSVKFISDNADIGEEFIRLRSGFLSPYLNLYDELTGMENLMLFSKLKDPGRRDVSDELRELLLFVGLYERRNDQFRAYSSGMKQKLKIAFALLHEPELLLLDEPRSNLDKEGIEMIEKMAEAQKSRGILIIATNDEDDLKLCSQRISIEEYK